MHVTFDYVSILCYKLNGYNCTDGPLSDIYDIRIRSNIFWGCMRAASTWRPWVSGLVGHFVQTWPDSELLSHSAVLKL